jgi:hypothetical protein
LKVALILYGQPRFIDRPDVYNSYKQYLFDRYDVDVFGHMWWSPGMDYGPISSWAEGHGAKPHIPEEALKIAWDQYKPIDLFASGPRKFKPKPEIRDYLENRWTDSEYYSKDNFSNILSALASIQCATYLFRDEADGYKFSDKNPYDFFVLGRYDAVLDNFPLLTDDMKDDKFYLPSGGHFNDLIHFWHDTKYNTWLFDLFYEVYGDMELHQKVELPIPELYKYHSFVRRFGEDSLQKNEMYAHVIRR